MKKKLENKRNKKLDISSSIRKPSEDNCEIKTNMLISNDQ